MESEEAGKLRRLIALQPESDGWKLQNSHMGALYEAERRFTIDGEVKLQSAASRRKLMPLAGRGLRRKENTEVHPGKLYLSRFLKLLAYINENCPWCNRRFPTNDEMLQKMTAALLPFITETAAVARAHSDRLKNLIRSNLKGSNVLWISNRQQGKTTTLSKIISCLMLASPASGNLAFIYSTSLDRAAEVMRASKAIVDWVRSTTIMDELGFPCPVRIEMDNSREYHLKSGYGVTNKCRSRPKGADQCRGDAPKAVFCDEIAFVENSWYTRFLLPLQSVSERVFIYTTTPPLSGSWFSTVVQMVKDANAKNDWHFEYTSHTLACEECSAANVGAQCVHNLAYVPAWKSLIKMSSLQRLVPASERTAFNTEVLGMEEQNTAGYIDQRLLTALREAPRKSLPNKIDRVFVAIDPASHRRSSMGLAAVCFGEHGEYIILAGATIQCSRPQLVQVQLVIKKFLTKLRALPECGRSAITPIVECNGSEIYSASLVEVFNDFPPVVHSFNAKETNVAQGIGIFTTHSSKIWSLTNLLSSLLKNSVRVSPNFFTVCDSIYNAHAAEVPAEDALKIILQQLSSFRDREDGAVSGKEGNTEDDAGMALLLGTQWAIHILHDERGPNRRI